MATVRVCGEDKIGGQFSRIYDITEGLSSLGFVCALVQVLTAAFWEGGEGGCLIEHIICTLQSDISHQAGIQFQREIEGEKNNTGSF